MQGAKMRSNYIVINNNKYEIYHFDEFGTTQKPSGIGYGAGTGLGMNLELNEKIKSGLFYNIQFSETNLTENLQPTNAHHTIGIRIIWN